MSTNYVVEDAVSGLVRIEKASVIAVTKTAAGVQAEIDAVGAQISALNSQKSELQDELSAIQAALAPAE